MSQSIEIWQFCWFFDTYTSFGANLALGKFGLGKYGSGQIWPGQTWVWANLASGKFGSGQTWAGAKVAGQTWSGKIWFGQTWDVIVRLCWCLWGSKFEFGPKWDVWMCSKFDSLKFRMFEVLSSNFGFLFFVPSLSSYFSSPQIFYLQVKLPYPRQLTAGGL